MWWNWIPVASFALTGAYLAVALPHEVSARLLRVEYQFTMFACFQEKQFEEDLITGTSYAEYKKQTKYRLIPYIW